MTHLSPPAPKSCGGCTLCCTLVPVAEAALTKPAFAACPHAREAFHARQGCGIYPTRPHACRVWTCVWLTSPDLPDALRPDRSGIVIDPVVDLIRVDGREHPAAQVWAAPGYEMAFQGELVAGALSGLLDQVPFVLWRQRGADGAQWGRAIARDADCILQVGPLIKSDFILGTEQQRQARVDELMAQRAGAPS